MFGKLQYGKFAVPENPVKNGALGMGYLGDSMGQPVIGSSINAISMSPADAGGNSVAGSMGPVGLAINSGSLPISNNGAGIDAPPANPYGNPNAVTSDKYTPEYCNDIITGKISPGAADQFQCSLRSMVGVRPAFTTGNNIQPVSPSALITPPATVAQIHQSMVNAASPLGSSPTCPSMIGVSGGGVAQWINDNPFAAIGFVLGLAFALRGK